MKGRQLQLSSSCPTSRHGQSAPPTVSVSTLLGVEFVVSDLSWVPLPGLVSYDWGQWWGDRLVSYKRAVRAGGSPQNRLGGGTMGVAPRKGGL